MQTIRATSIGFLAYTALDKAGPIGTVSRVTPKGLLVEAGPSTSFWVALDAWCSPLTLNLGQTPDDFASIEAGEVVVLMPGELELPDRQLLVNVPDETLWLPSESPAVQPQQRARLEKLSQVLMPQPDPAGWMGILPILLQNEPAAVSDAVPDALRYPCHQIQAALDGLRSGSPEATYSALDALLGLGSGLIPSGDLALTGLLLVLSRWPREFRLRPKLRLSALTHHLLETAKQKTTPYAARTLEVASLGQGDERLLIAADYLVGGEGEAESIAAALSSFGGSSGFDALVGMATALISLD